MTTHRSRRRFRATLLALVTLLLAQWTLATHACPRIQQAADWMAQAIWAEALAADFTDSVTPADTALPPCHTAARGAPAGEDGSSPTCVKHCADEGSTSGSAVLTVAAAPPPLVLRAIAPLPPATFRFDRPLAGDATAPPLTILYCVFLT